MYLLVKKVDKQSQLMVFTRVKEFLSKHVKATKPQASNLMMGSLTLGKKTLMTSAVPSIAELRATAPGTTRGRVFF